jgi:RNA polymerase sigma-70 factor, ECF subfamily
VCFIAGAFGPIVGLMVSSPSSGASSVPRGAYIQAPSTDGNGGADGTPSLVDARERIASGLVRRAKDGDKDAFGEIYRWLRPSVYRLARFHAGEVVAEDIVAETFMRAWTSLPRYRETGAPFASWVYGIARHVAIDEVRRSGRSEPRDDLPETGVETGVEDRLALAEAIGQLPEEQRLVIELKYLADLTNAEVAAMIGATVGAVNAKQWRALRTLRDLLHEERPS